MFKCCHVIGRVSVLVATWSGTSHLGAQGTTTQPDVGTPGDRTATLQWDAVPDGRVRGYRVYVGGASRNYYLPRGSGLDVGNTTVFRVGHLNPGRTYYFAVTAYDKDGNESAYSTEAAKSIR